MILGIEKAAVEPDRAEYLRVDEEACGGIQIEARGVEQLDDRLELLRHASSAIDDVALARDGLGKLSWDVTILLLGSRNCHRG